MKLSNHGALGMTYTVVRVMQAICLITIIGMTANFISEMVSHSTAPPNVLIATLSIVVIATLYTTLSTILYIDNILPLLATSILDAIFLLTLLIITILVGKPLSYLNCAALNQDGGNIDAFLSSIADNLGSVTYYVWAGANAAVCFECKALWGLCIALCVLFAMSAVVLMCLWRLGRGKTAVKSVV